MKKKWIFSWLMIFSLFSYAKEILVSAEPCEIKESFYANESNRRVSEITSEQLKEDLEYITYYLSTAYIGYNLLLKNGYNAEHFNSFFLTKYALCENIDTKLLLNEFNNYFKPYVKDGHFSISGSYGIENVYPVSHSVIYFSNTFVKKTNEDFLLFETDSSEIRRNERYTGNAENLFRYPSKGDTVYRLGILSDERIEEANFEFENKSIKIPVYDDGCIESNNSIKYHEIESTKSGYVSLSSFLLPEKHSQYRKGAEIIFEKFMNLSSKWNKKDNIVIDLRGNLGGLEIYGEVFLYTLLKNKKYKLKLDRKIENFYDENFKNQIWIESPATIQIYMEFLNVVDFANHSYIKFYSKKMNEQQRVPKKKVFSKKSKKTFFEKSFYNGNLVFIIDRNSASSAEIMALYAKKIFGFEKVFVIGENSYGCLEYKNILNCLLPNSKIFFQLGTIKNDFVYEFSEWHGEGYGIYPDYWSIGSDLNETIFLVTGDEEMKEKLKNIEFRLQ